MLIRYQNVLILALIIILGFILRFYQLVDIPNGFFADEAANGFNAYKILTTGKDEYGINFPFYFHSFGDWRNPVAIYSMIPFIAISGLNEFSIRLTMVFYGTANILFLYLLVKEMFLRSPPRMKEIASLGAAGFLAISPWHIHFSRSGFEIIPLPFFITLSLFLFFRFLNIKKEKTKPPLILLSLTMLSFVITFYTYYPVQIVLIPFIAGLFIFYRDSFFHKKNLQIFLLSLLILLIGLIPFIAGTLSGGSITRFKSVSPLAKGLSLEILIPMAKTYIDHFSLDFLFIKGDINMPGHFITRHSVAGMGELYLLQLPLIIFGFIILLFKEFRIWGIITIWLILYPLGSTVIGEEPFSHRSIFGLVPFQILSGYGLAYLIYYIFKLSKKRFHYFFLSFFGVIFLAIILISFKDYLNKYFIQYPLYSSDFWGWQYGPREIIKYFLAHKNSYDVLYMSGEFNAGEIFLKFYDPQNSCLGKCKFGDLYRNPEIYDRTKKQLFSLSPDYLSKSDFKDNFLIKSIIYYPDGKPAFLIGTVDISKFVMLN